MKRMILALWALLVSTCGLGFGTDGVMGDSPPMDAPAGAATGNGMTAAGRRGAAGGGDCMRTDQLWDWESADLSAVGDGNPAGAWPNTGSQGVAMDMAAAGTARPLWIESDPNLGIPTVKFDGINDRIASATLGSPLSPPFTYCSVWMSPTINTVFTQYLHDIPTATSLRAYGFNTSGSPDKWSFGTNATIENTADLGQAGVSPLTTESGQFRWNWGCWLVDGANSASYMNFNDESFSLTNNDVAGLNLGSRGNGTAFMNGSVVRFSMWSTNALDLEATARCYANTYIGPTCTFPAGSPCTNGEVCRGAIVGDSFDEESNSPNRDWYSLLWKSDLKVGTVDTQHHCLQVDNFAVGSKRTDEIETEQLAVSVSGKDYDFIVYGGGINDIAWVSYNRATVIAQMESSWTTMLAEGKRIFVRPVYPTLTESGTEIDALNANTMTFIGLNSGISLLTGFNGSNLHDRAEGTTPNSIRGDWDGDGVHVNTLGAQAIARALNEEVGMALPAGEPPVTTNLQVWLDSRDVDGDSDYTDQSEGASIQTWVDKGLIGDDLTQATANKRPSLVGGCTGANRDVDSYCVHFDDTSSEEDWMAASTTSNYDFLNDGTNYTVYILSYQDNDISTQASILDTGHLNSGSEAGTFFFYDNAGGHADYMLLQGDVTQNDPSIQPTANDAPVDNWHVATYVCEFDVRCDIYTNGTLTGSDTSLVASAHEDGATGPLHLGTVIDENTYFFKGDIAQVMIFTGNHDTSTRESVEEWLYEIKGGN